MSGTCLSWSAIHFAHCLTLACAGAALAAAAAPGFVCSTAAQDFSAVSATCWAATAPAFSAASLTRCASTAVFAAASSAASLAAAAAAVACAACALSAVSPSPSFQTRGLGVGLGGRDARPLRPLGARDHRLGFGRRGLDRGREQLLLLAVGLELRELGLLAHDLLCCLGLGEGSRLVGPRLCGRDLRARLRLPQRYVTRGIDLDLLSFSLADRRLLVGRGFGHACIT